MPASTNAIKFLNQIYTYGGISQSAKVGIKGSFTFGQRLNIFDEPTQLTIMPSSINVSGTIVTDLVKWMVIGAPYNTNLYAYSENGVIYVQNNSGIWSVLRTVSNSHGQGLEVFEDYLYYASDYDLGRYGPLDGTPTFTDNFGSTVGITLEGGTGTINNTATTKFAPLKHFPGGLAFGNGNQLSWWDNNTLTTDMLTFRDGDNVRAIDITDQYLVIGTWRGTSVTTSNDGFIYLWDSYSSSFNITTSIPQGGCMALLNYKNRIMTFAGGTGQLLMNYSPFTNVQTIPNVPLTNTVEIYPGAMTNWLGLAQFGVSGYTNASNLYQGVYSYGSKTQLYPEVLNYSFSISSGVTQNTSMRIGCCYGVGNSLYVSWYDGSNYGVDCITNSNAPYSTAVFESLIFDNGELYKDKLLKALKVYHSPLVAGQSIALGYKLNRASSYTTAITNTTVGSTETKANIAGMQARFRELQFEVILGTSGSASPAVLYSGAEINDLGAERSF